MTEITTTCVGCTHFNIVPEQKNSGWDNWKAVIEISCDHHFFEEQETTWNTAEIICKVVEESETCPHWAERMR